MENYLHMDQIHERMNKVTICETRHKRPLIKGTNKGCLQMCWCALHIFKGTPISFPPCSPLHFKCFIILLKENNVLGTYTLTRDVLFCTGTMPLNLLFPRNLIMNTIDMFTTINNNIWMYNIQLRKWGIL